MGAIKKFFSWLSKQLGAKFGIGIITLLPLAATAWIIYWMFIHIDDILQPVIKAIWHTTIPGAGFAATLLIILIVGFIASNVIGRRLIRIGESVIPNLPIVQQLYSGIKQIMESFSPSAGSGHTMKTVIIEFPRKGMQAIGFITSEVTDDSGKKLFFVYIPNSPNPTSGGFLEIVEESEVIHTDISIQDAFRTIVSAGRVVPPEVSDSLFYYNKERKPE